MSQIWNKSQNPEVLGTLALFSHLRNSTFKYILLRATRNANAETFLAKGILPRRRRRFCLAPSCRGNRDIKQFSSSLQFCTYDRLIFVMNVDWFSPSYACLGPNLIKGNVSEALYLPAEYTVRVLLTFLTCKQAFSLYCPLWSKQNAFPSVNRNAAQKRVKLVYVG